MNSERIGVYAGSFDPVTRGHMDVILRASALFDRVIVAVAVNVNKQGWLSSDQRLELLKSACEGIGNVSVDSFSGLTAEYAASVGACALIRGLRGSADCESEQALSELNRVIAPELETVFFLSRPELRMVSSSAVREMAAFGGPWAALVPPETAGLIRLYRNLQTDV